MHFMPCTHTHYVTLWNTYVCKWNTVKPALLHTKPPSSVTPTPVSHTQAVCQHRNKTHFSFSLYSADIVAGLRTCQTVVLKWACSTWPCCVWPVFLVREADWENSFFTWRLGTNIFTMWVTKHYLQCTNRVKEVMSCLYFSIYYGGVEWECIISSSSVIELGGNRQIVGSAAGIQTKSADVRMKKTSKVKDVVCARQGLFTGKNARNVAPYQPGKQSSPQPQKRMVRAARHHIHWSWRSQSGSSCEHPWPHWPP